MPSSYHGDSPTRNTATEMEDFILLLNGSTPDTNDRIGWQAGSASTKNLWQLNALHNRTTYRGELLRTHDVSNCSTDEGVMAVFICDSTQPGERGPVGEASPNPVKIWVRSIPSVE